MSQVLSNSINRKASQKSAKQMKKTMKPGEHTVLWVSRVIIWIVIVITLIPMWFVVEAALNPTNSFFSFSLWPKHASLQNFVALFQGGGFLTWIRNSSIVSLTVAVGQVVLTATGAFAFSRLRFWGRKYGLMTLFIIQLFPNFLSIAAIYAGLSKLNMIDDLWAYILVLMGGSAYQMWLLKGYFDSVPKELDEAGIMDGASSWQRFWRIIMPLSLPMLVVIFFFQLIATFDEYILAGTILTSPNNYNLGIGMYGLISDHFAKNWGQFSAAALITAVPLAVVFGLLNRWISSGLVAGSLKG